ncbi:hypothetical protein [Acholeplasma equifetale]|uniref:hypothetical protein n=1 Tax=Acholeplasma equifetale TaxID=264634 RepID=UPI00047900B3|nr:hypothetical protein [Acholeplasma equifetale]
MQNKAFNSVFCLRYFKEGKVKERKTIKHRQFTIDEKNEIVKGVLISGNWRLQSVNEETGYLVQ